MGKVIHMKKHQGMDYKALQEKKRREAEAEGGQSLQRLMRTRKLRLSDRELIARRLYRFLEQVFEANPELRRGDFAKYASLSSGDDESSKEIWRLTLSSESDNVKKLRASGRNYAQLIKAVAKTSGRNVNQFTDEITFGTSVHPANCVNLDVEQRVLAAIQFIGNTVDREVDLLTKFKKIGKKKCELLLAGGLCDWPFGYFEEPLEHDTQYMLYLGDPTDEMYSHYRDPTDEMYSYWDKGNRTEVDFESIKNLPHIHLGMFWDYEYETPGEAWDKGDFDNYTEEFLKARKKFWEKYNSDTDDDLYSEKPWEYLDTGLFSDKTELDAVPRKVVIDETTKKPVYMDCYGLMANLDYWLVLYPNKEMTGLEPILWSHGGDYTNGMMEMESLTMRKLNEMREIRVISQSEETLFDRLIQTLRPVSEQDDKSILLREWSKTSKYLEACPLWPHVKCELDLDEDFNRIFNVEDVKR